MYTCHAPLTLACGASSPWWTCITANFIHANLLHVMLNVSVLFAFSLYGYRNYNRVVLIGLAVASLAFFALSGNIPSCGLSGVIFSVYGILVARCRQKRDLIMSAVCIAVTFIPPLNGMLHLVCWAAGFIIGIIYAEKVRHHKG